MYTNRFISHLRSKCNYRVCFLAFFWVIGLLLGVMSAVVYSKEAVIFIDSSRSFFSVFFVSTIPFMLCSLALCISAAFLYPIILCRAISFGFSSAALIISYGDCGWLIRCFVMLSGICSACIIWLYLLGQLCNGHEKPVKGLVFMVPVLAIISLVDTYAIVPFVQKFLPYL